MYDENYLYEFKMNSVSIAHLYKGREIFMAIVIFCCSMKILHGGAILVSPAISVINSNLKNGLVLCLGTQNSEMKLGYIKLS